MSAVGLAAQIAAAKVTIAALTPNTSPSTTFLQCGDDLRLLDDNRTRDRLFGVYARAPGKIADQVFTDSAQFTGTMIVEVRYDAAADHAAVGQRMSEDAEQIKYACLVGTQGTGVQLAMPDDGEFLPANGNEGSHFWILRIPFQVTYVRTF